MAVADMGGAVGGKKVEVVFADHQNKADVAAAKAREVVRHRRRRHADRRHQLRHRLAMAKVAVEKKKLFIAIGAATSALTNEQCNPYTVHWAYDTVALAKGTGNAVVKQGGKTWFFLTADYAFGARCRTTPAVVRRRRRQRWSARCATRCRPPTSPRPSCCRRRPQQGRDPRPGQRRRRHHQLDQGRQRVRHHQDEPSWPACWSSSTTSTRPGPEDHAGHVPDRQLVLEPRRRRAPGAASSSRRSSACLRRSRPATTRPRCTT